MDSSVIGLKELREHPVIRELCKVVSRTGGISLMVVHATDGHWKQERLCGGSGGKTDFCRLVQSSEQGARECRLCHVLMTVAACSGGAVVQHCHAGASAFIAPASQSSSDSLAIVSSCMFSEVGEWESVRRRGEALGLDPDALHRAYLDLPRVTEEQQELSLLIMNALGLALNMIVENAALKARVKHRGSSGRAEPLEALFKDTDWMNEQAAGNKKREAGDVPLLVRVACELVQQRPDLQLGVKELASAARVTPNYFSTLFTTHTGSSFVEYQTNVRMQRAQKLLNNVTLNVSDVARRVGYEDSGYFARRFRQKTGRSPTQWRNDRGKVDSGDARE